MRNLAPRLDTPSKTQAGRIAFLWSRGQTTAIDGEGGYNDPTTMVLVRQGWLEQDGTSGVRDNRAHSTWIGYKVSAAGLFALERYLAKLRMTAK